MTDRQSSFPANVNEAVRLLTGLVPEDEQARIAAMPETDLVDLHFGLGKWMRNNLGLWNADSALLKSTGQPNADGASDLIVRAFWQKLKDEMPKVHCPPDDFGKLTSSPISSDSRKYSTIDMPAPLNVTRETGKCPLCLRARREGIMKTTTHSGCQCQALARTVTISNDSAAVLDRLMSSYSLSESAMLERLVLSAERNAIEVAKTLPNGHACYNAFELRLSASQQDSILSALIHADTTG